MGELHLPRLRGAVGFIADSSWREHRIEVFHDLPGQLVGQNSLNIGCGKQFGGCALPCSDTIDVVSHFPKVTRHSLSDNLFCAFFLVQHPNAVLFVQTQCFVVHVAPGHKNAGGLAHTLALHDPAGIGRTHQTVGACNLLERIVCGLFAQMVDQQNADVILVSQCFQRADLLVITGIHTVVLIAGTNLLQGVDDDQPGVRVLIEETCKLLFQPLPDAATFRLHDQPFGGFFAAHQLEKALLQAVKGVLQRKIKHGVRLYFASPHRLALRDLQAQPQGQPAFARFAGAGKQRQPCRKQIRDDPLDRRQRRGEEFFGGDRFWKFFIIHSHRPFCFGIDLLSHTIVILCVVSFILQC